MAPLFAAPNGELQASPEWLSFHALCGRSEAGDPPVVRWDEGTSESGGRRTLNPPTAQTIRRAGWQTVAGGYRHLRNAMYGYLFGVPLTFALRVVLPPSLAILVSLFVAFGVLLLFLNGALALAKKPSGKSGKVLGIALAVFAFIPVVNVVVFPLLLTLYTRAVGIDIGNRSVVCTAWVLLACAVILVVPVVYLVNMVVDLATSPVPVQPTKSNPDPVAFEVLFGVAVGAVLWLGAYIVSIMILSSVPRAIEKRLQKDTSPEELVPDPEVIADEKTPT